MLGITLAMVVALGRPEVDPVDPAILVEQLGAARYLERESAEKQLGDLGRRSLPALQAARSSKNPEIQLRVGSLVGRIERSLLLQPTSVALDLGQVPLGGGIETINGQSGLRLVLDPAAGPGVARRSLTLKVAEPLPFWQAVDRICEAGRLHYSFGVPGPLGLAEGSFLLQDGPVAGPPRVSDSGPFRVQVVGFEQGNDATMPPTRGTFGRGMIIDLDERAASRARVIRPLLLQMIVAGEPGLSVTPNGSVVLTQAVDDQGHSLITSPGQGMVSHSSGYFGVNPSPVARVRVELARTGGSVQRVKKLKGTIPIVVSTRRANPLEISLRDSVGKPVPLDDGKLIVTGSQAGGVGQPSTIEVTVNSRGISRPNRGLDPDMMTNRSDIPQQQLEVLDDQGQPLPWFPARLRYSDGEVQVTLSVRPRAGAREPALIRYHGMIQTTTEVPFEFRDVPIR